MNGTHGTLPRRTSSYLHEGGVSQPHVCLLHEPQAAKEGKRQRVKPPHHDPANPEPVRETITGELHEYLLARNSSAQSVQIKDLD